MTLTALHKVTFTRKQKGLYNSEIKHLRNTWLFDQKVWSMDVKIFTSIIESYLQEQRLVTDI